MTGPFVPGNYVHHEWNVGASRLTTTSPPYVFYHYTRVDPSTFECNKNKIQTVRPNPLGSSNSTHWCSVKIDSNDTKSLVDAIGFAPDAPMWRIELEVYAHELVYVREGARQKSSLVIDYEIKMEVPLTRCTIVAI